MSCNTYTSRLAESTSCQIAGMVSKVFDHPFDLCKVRLQAQVLDHSARFRGPVDCLTQTWKNEGIRGLYRVSFPVTELFAGFLC